MMLEWKDYHKIALDYISKAEHALETGDDISAKRYYGSAGWNEYMAALALPINRKRTLSLIGLNAIMFYIRSEKYDNAFKLSVELLDGDITNKTKHTLCNMITELSLIFSDKGMEIPHAYRK